MDNDSSDRLKLSRSSAYYASTIAGRQCLPLGCGFRNAFRFANHHGRGPNQSIQARLIGIGAAVTHRPLPHHRAYGSVHGGSRWLR
jgi:hypothetical protein